MPPSPRTYAASRADRFVLHDGASNRSPPAATPRVPREAHAVTTRASGRLDDQRVADAPRLIRAFTPGREDATSSGGRCRCAPGGEEGGSCRPRIANRRRHPNQENLSSPLHPRRKTLEAATVSGATSHTASAGRDQRIDVRTVRLEGRIVTPRGRPREGNRASVVATIVWRSSAARSASSALASRAPRAPSERGTSPAREAPAGHELVDENAHPEITESWESPRHRASESNSCNRN